MVKGQSLKIDRFHLAACQFSNRSQTASKYGMKKRVAHEEQPSVSLRFLLHFDVFFVVLLYRTTSKWKQKCLFYEKKSKMFLVVQVSSMGLTTSRS